ncbi:unnamed protein product, partial [Iphiclides podalirius]
MSMSEEGSIFDGYLSTERSGQEQIGLGTNNRAARWRGGEMDSARCGALGTDRSYFIDGSRFPLTRLPGELHRSHKLRYRTAHRTTGCPISSHPVFKDNTSKLAMRMFLNNPLYT